MPSTRTSFAGSTTIAARRSKCSQPAWARRMPSPGAVATTGSWRRSAVRTSRASGLPSGPTAVVLPLEERAVGPGFALATRLRHAGLQVGLEPPGRSLKALLRAADRQGARLAVILGGEELAAGRATLRDLVRGEDRRLALPLDAPASAVLAWVEPGATA